MLCSGPNGNFVIFSTVPSQLMARQSCSLYPPAPGLPSGTHSIGSMERTMPGSSTVSTSSLSSSPGCSSDQISEHSALSHLPAIVVGDDPEAVAVPECPELQHAELQQDRVQLLRDLTAPRPRPDLQTLQLSHLSGKRALPAPAPAGELRSSPPSSADSPRRTRRGRRFAPVRCSIPRRPFGCWMLNIYFPINLHALREAVQHHYISPLNFPPA